MKVNSAYKMLVTSKRISSLLGEEIPSDITVNIRYASKGHRPRGNTKQWLALMATGSSNVDTNDSESASLDGHSTSSADEGGSDNAAD